MTKRSVRWLAVPVAMAISLPIAWYLLSPIWRVIEVEEDSPLDAAGAVSASAPSAGPSSAVMVKDALDAMDRERRMEFEARTEEMKDDVMVGAEAMPSAPKIVARAAFQPRAHDVKGRAVLIEAAGGRILRFEDFETINGPDLRILLSADLGVDDAVEVGPIRATKGSVNYALDPSIDASKYRNVLVWCQDFSVLFSYAVLR